MDPLDNRDLAPELTDKQKAIKIIRKEIRLLQQKVGVFPKEYIDMLNNIVRQIKDELR